MTQPTNTRPGRSLESLLAKATYQSQALKLISPGGEQFVNTPDDMYNRFLQVEREQKGHYSSGYGEYGRSLGFSLDFKFSDFICPGLEVVKPSAGFTGKGADLSHQLFLIHRNMPAYDPTYKSENPVGFFQLKGKKQAGTLNLKAAFESGIPTPSILDKQDVLCIALGLEITLEGTIDAQHMSLRDRAPQFFPSSLSTALRNAFHQSLKVPTLGEVKKEVVQWYKDFLQILIDCFNEKKVAYEAALTAMDRVQKADGKIKLYLPPHTAPANKLSAILKPRNILNNLKSISGLVSSSKTPVSEDPPDLKILNALYYYEVVGLYTTKTPAFSTSLRSARDMAQIIVDNHPSLPEQMQGLISEADLTNLSTLISAIGQVDLNQADADIKINNLPSGFTQTPNRDQFQRDIKTYFTNLRHNYVSSTAIEGAGDPYQSTKNGEKAPKSATLKTSPKGLYLKIKASKKVLPEIVELLQQRMEEKSIEEWTIDKVKSGIQEILKKAKKTPDKEEVWKTSGLLDELKLTNASVNTLPKDDVLGRFSNFIQESLKAKIKEKVTEKFDMIEETPFDDLSMPEGSQSLKQELQGLIDSVNMFLQNPYWKHAVTIAGADLTQLQKSIDWINYRILQADTQSTGKKTPPSSGSSSSGANPPAAVKKPAICRLDVTAFTASSKAYAAGKAEVKAKINGGISNLPSLKASSGISASIEGLIHYKSFRYQSYGFLDDRKTEKYIQTQDTLLKQKELLLSGGELDNENQSFYAQITYKSAVSNWFENSPMILQKGSGLVYGCSVELGRIRAMLDNQLKNNPQAILEPEQENLLQIIAQKLRVNKTQLKEAIHAIKEEGGPDKSLWDTETLFMESSFAFDLEKINPELQKLNKDISTTDMLSIAPVKKYRTLLSNACIPNRKQAPVPADNFGYLEAIHLRLILAKNADNSKTIFGFTPKKISTDKLSSAKLTWGKEDRAGLESVVELACKFFAVQGANENEQYDHAVPPLTFVHQAHHILQTIEAGSQDNSNTSTS